ncbi:MAG TPA: T9SS type A sorting domain-containing protein, partial [Bacteroidia bacterium]|nr:T9SS type A sorting domain-containing protein [Bacteroidia bacterium]
ICITLLAEPTTGDINPANNIETICRPISNSCDPNEKHVSPNGDVISGSWLTYTIFFQNTGNDTAYSVFILDTMDANLDMNTFQPIAASHSYYTYIQDGNAVKFDFPNIMLVDSNANEPLSHGWVSYRIKSNTGLSNGTNLNNTAYIYFDFNSAVITNTTVTVIDNGVSVGEINSATGTMILSPNPASAQLIIDNGQLKINAIEIYDMLGQRVYMSQQATNSKCQTVDVSGLSPGIYFVKVKGEKSEQVMKFVKQ